MVLTQAVQVVGALLILAAFSAVQFGWLDSRSARYLVLNVVGGFILAVLALYERQWGFLLLESVWTVVSLWSLFARGGGEGDRAT